MENAKMCAFPKPGKPHDAEPSSYLLDINIMYNKTSTLGTCVEIVRFAYDVLNSKKKTLEEVLFNANE